MKNYLFFLFFLICLISFGQNQSKIDSLNVLFNASKTNKEKAVVALSLSKIHTISDKNLSVEYALKSLNYIANTANYALLEEIYIQLAELYYYQKKDNLAILYLNKIDSLYAKDNVLNEASFMAKIYRSEISKFTFTMEGVMQAKKYILEAQNLAKKHHNTEFINEAKYHLAEWHGFLSQEVAPKENLDTAKMYIHEIIPYFKSKNNYTFLSKAYNTLASVEIASKNYKAARHYYNERLQHIKKTGDTISIGEAYYSFGVLFRQLKQPERGLIYLDSALAIFNKIGFRTAKRKKDLYKDYAYIYEQKGDYKNAFTNMYKALLLKDTIYDNENTIQAMELEKKYQTQKKEGQIALLKTENELATQQKINQRNLFITGISIASIVGLFFFFLYRNRQKTTRKLKELDKAKSNFFANISHEFLTPITLISGPIQKLLKEKDISHDERSNLEMMQRNANRLLTLVDQLLDISKFESCGFKLAVSQENIGSFMGAVADGFTFSAIQKKIDYKITITPSQIDTWFDKSVLDKIVVNLLSNAIKYTPMKGSIVFTVSVKDKFLYVEVKNTGKGLTVEEIDKVFERFYQVSINNQGVGVGLALVKELVALHKGTIHVKSTSAWTTFSVILPVNKAAFKENEITNNQNDLTEPQCAHQTTSAITYEKEDLKYIENNNNEERPILLLADDNADIRAYVGNLFKDTYEIVLAKNGEEGIELAITHIPDIIISDIMMPIVDGIELCSTLKTDERTSHIPILLLTAKAGEENEIEGIETGADAYITKPFSDDVLRLWVEKLIESRKKLQAHYRQEVILIPQDIHINSTDELFLKRVQSILDGRLTESSFYIDGFCKAVGMSRMQLHRKLKALTGLSASAFIRSERLKLAAQLLKESDANISQIGYTVGFNDHAYFSKCFKEMYDCSPSEYANRS